MKHGGLEIPPIEFDDFPSERNLHLLEDTGGYLKIGSHQICPNDKPLVCVHWYKVPHS